MLSYGARRTNGFHPQSKFEPTCGLNQSNITLLMCFFFIDTGLPKCQNSVMQLKHNNKFRNRILTHLGVSKVK